MKKGIRAHDVEEKGLENICKRCKKQGILCRQQTELSLKI